MDRRGIHRDHSISDIIFKEEVARNSKTEKTIGEILETGASKDYGDLLSSYQELKNSPERNSLQYEQLAILSGRIVDEFGINVPDLIKTWEERRES